MSSCQVTATAAVVANVVAAVEDNFSPWIPSQESRCRRAVTSFTFCLFCFFSPYPRLGLLLFLCSENCIIDPDILLDYPLFSLSLPSFTFQPFTDTLLLWCSQEGTSDCCCFPLLSRLTIYWFCMISLFYAYAAMYGSPWDIHSLKVVNVIKLMRARYSSLDQFLSASYINFPIRIMFRVYTLVVFGYCLIPFILLSYSKWIEVLAQFYFFAHLIYIPYNLIISPFILPIVTRYLTREKHKKTE